MRWAPWLVAALVAGCAPAGETKPALAPASDIRSALAPASDIRSALATPGETRPALDPTVGSRPALAPAPSPRVTTVDLTLSRTSFAGVTQSIQIRPDGEWFFTPATNSALSVAINHGRLDGPTHARLAQLLAAPALRTEAALPSGTCPGGYRYSLATPATTATWTDCEAPDRPTLSAVLTLIRTSEPSF